ncbi:MAG TPA: PEP-CTERM sorting domain-containing protein [Bryobacteraceae bacterium]|nr:PEP-CTERM sorting domain-containing protein [Bryobacteraceae bacterium]
MYRFKSGAIFLLTLMTLAVMATPAFAATITTYTSSASWLAATTSDQLDNFEGLAPSGSYVTGAFSDNGVQFIGLSSATIGLADTSTGSFSFANFGTGDAVFVFGTSTAQITVPTPVTAFGINLFSAPVGLNFTVTTLSTPFNVPTSSTAPPTFFGVTSDTPFSTIDVQIPTGGTYTFFDNFQWGTAQTGGGSEVPEAGTFLLIGTGLVGFAVFRHRGQPRA